MRDYKKIKKAIKDLLDGVGHPSDDINILETPERVAKMFGEILDGYYIEPKKYLKVFPHEGKEMVIVRNVPFYSYCAHHLQPFFGKMTIAYIPDGEVLGLSKLVRISRVYAKRLQLQERLTQEIAEFIYENVRCVGVAVNIKAQHMCMVIRGVRSYGAETVTSKLLGDFVDNADLRKEFFANVSDKEGY